MSYLRRETPREAIPFRYPVTDKILFAFGILLFGAGAYVCWLTEAGNAYVITSGFFSALSVLALIFSFDSITLTDSEIIRRRVFQEQRLAWMDIYEVIPTSIDSFSLRDRSGDVKIYVTSQLKGFPELAWLIQQKRPELWQIQNSRDPHAANVFHQPPWGALYYGLGGIGVILFAFFFKDDTAGPALQWFGRIFAICLGLGLLYIVTHEARKLEFSGSHLIVSYFGGWKKRIHISEVGGLEFGQEYHRTTNVNMVILKLKTGKKLSFSGYKEGMPMLVNALEKWMETYQAD